MRRQIIEWDKDIAVFMGNVRKDRPIPNGGWKHWNIKPFGYFEDEELKYHLSWEWLRPVFDKWLELPSFADSSVQALSDNYTARIAHLLAYGTCQDACKQIAIAISWYKSQTSQNANQLVEKNNEKK